MGVDAEDLYKRIQQPRGSRESGTLASAAAAPTQLGDFLRQGRQPGGAQSLAVLHGTGGSGGTCSERIASVFPLASLGQS